MTHIWVVMRQTVNSSFSLTSNCAQHKLRPSSVTFRYILQNYDIQINVQLVESFNKVYKTRE